MASVCQYIACGYAAGYETHLISISVVTGVVGARGRSSEVRPRMLFFAGRGARVLKVKCCAVELMLEQVGNQNSKCFLR